MTDLAAFIACAIVIYFAGGKLSVYSAAISSSTRLSNVWIGVVLLASVTSFPELMVGIGSSAIVGSADLAVADVLGSCAFNLGILAMMDVLMPKRKSLFGIASVSHVMAAALSILLVVLVGAGLYVPDELVVTKWLVVLSAAFMLLYFVSMRLIYFFEKKSVLAAERSSTEQQPLLSLKKAVTLFVVYSIVIVGAALLLPTFANRIAIQTGLGNTFVGTIFLAASTSMPEIAVSISSIRRGYVNLAVGNLFGSNMFNVFILAVDDMFYLPGPILKHASDAQLISVFGVIAMSAVAIIGLTYRSEQKRFALAWDALAILVIYALQLLLLYHVTVE
jgi:cation:H+ antiporter